MGKIPPAEFDGPPPEKPANAETDPHARMAYLARAKKYAQDKAANHSDRCSVNYKIEIARAVSVIHFGYERTRWLMEFGSQVLGRRVLSAA